MTTTVQRSESGAVQRIPSGALRMTPLITALYVPISFCNETSAGYWNVANHPQSDENIRKRAIWEADVAEFEALMALFADSPAAASPQIVHLPDSVWGEVIKPPGTDYPEALRVTVMGVHPDSARFAEIVTDNGRFIPTSLLVDATGSMWQPDYILEPGLTDYYVNPPSGIPPRVEYFGAEDDERWLHWIVVELQYYLTLPE